MKNINGKEQWIAFRQMILSHVLPEVPRVKLESRGQGKYCFVFTGVLEHPYRSKLDFALDVSEEHKENFSHIYFNDLLLFKIRPDFFYSGDKKLHRAIQAMILRCRTGIEREVDVYNWMYALIKNGQNVFGRVALRKVEFSKPSQDIKGSDLILTLEEPVSGVKKQKHIDVKGGYVWIPMLNIFEVLAAKELTDGCIVDSRQLKKMRARKPFMCMDEELEDFILSLFYPSESIFQILPHLTLGA